jgi:hypothetical protein
MKKIVFLFVSLFIHQVVISQVQVSYSKADNMDFSKFKTFQVNSLDVKNTPEFEPKKEGLNLLIKEINNQMISRGYEKVKENPDLIINIGLVITNETQTRQTDVRDAPMYIGQRNYHWESEEIVIRRYVEGTVTMDMVSSKDNEMIWQAVSSGILEKKREKNTKKIVKGVKKLFKKFPIEIKSL